jgi:hypothetical protein
MRYAAQMANQEHVDILAKGVKAWNTRRLAHPQFEPELNGASLEGEDLRGVDLGGAVLTGAKLSGANLSGADLSNANLVFAELGDETLGGMALLFMTPDHSFVKRGDLAGADFSGATMGNTTIGDVDIGAAKGLDAVMHRLPSTIGIDTVFLSGGKIPESFLRGCGVPETFIAYMHSLTGAAFDFYSCFISYSTKDQEFADRLHADL